MITTKSSTSPHIHHSKLGFRKPLQPKNIIPFSSNPISKDPKICQNNTSISMYPLHYGHSNKENLRVLSNTIEIIDASLAEELSAVRMRMERLRLDKEKTEKMLQERDNLLDFHMYELNERGEFQKELEIEVDRLFRLKQLKLACMSMSPIRSLREKSMDKKNIKVQFESAKSEDNKGELVNESSTPESSSLSMECTWVSTSTSVSTSSSTATSKMSMILPRLSLDSASDKCKI